MKADEWLGFFRKNTGKRSFSLSDILLMTGESGPSASVQLSRLTRTGLIQNPVKGWYVNPFDPPTAEELAMVVKVPSYLSMEYALSRSGVLSQEVFALTLVTPKLPHVFRTGSHVLEYHQIKRSLFWGYRKEGGVSIAEPEKALLDLIYIRYSRNRVSSENSILSLIEDMYTEELDKKRLIEYAGKFDKKTSNIVTLVF
jgi:hypothetical protein